MLNDLVNFSFNLNSSVLVEHDESSKLTLIQPVWPPTFEILQRQAQFNVKKSGKPIT